MLRPLQRLSIFQTSLKYSTMAPTNHYDLIVIGGGSAGMAFSSRSASYGAKTLVIEGNRLGGTCVNVGCVPKKVMWNASDLAIKTTVHASQYNIMAPYKLEFGWTAFKGKRDAYVERLNGIYANNLKKEDIDCVFGWADFVDEKTIQVELREGGTAKYTAEHITIAVGGQPSRVNHPEGADKIGITSNGFFELETQPKKVALVGSGYIAVELAGVFNGLGTETHLVIRHDRFLRNFDSVIGNTLEELYEKHGVHVHKYSDASAISKLPNGQIKLEVIANDGELKGKTTTLEVDEVVWAIGRTPFTYNLSLDKAGVKTDSKGKIVVDEYQNTNVTNIYSLGDVSEKVELTPAAIAAGRKLGDRLFGGVKDAKLDYTNIPSAIFSHPEAASVGISEEQAVKEHGKESVKTYNSRFINMYYSPMEQELKDPTVYKLVCVGKEEKVVGIHLVGDFSSEILQGFGVAVKMGATKKDLDSCVAIHPTAAEELVTMR